MTIEKGRVLESVALIRSVRAYDGIKTNGVTINGVADSIDQILGPDLQDVARSISTSLSSHIISSSLKVVTDEFALEEGVQNAGMQLKRRSSH